ncbi:MAG: asparagine synthase-related protein, partial [Armatimonadaceae bacterium]
QIGCPEPSPRQHRFLTPEAGNGPADIDALGAAYVGGALSSTGAWLETVPADAPIGVAFSGGIDSASVLLTVRHALAQMGRNPDNVRAFTLDLGGGADAVQAEAMVNELGLAHIWERV